jgi:hypothetical protein
LASSADPQSFARLFGTRGLLAQVHCRLRRGGGASHRTSQAGSVQVTEEVEEAFQLLKRALMTAPLLQLPDFDKRFIIDCDAFGIGFGIVLYQGDSAIAYFRRPVALHHQKLPAYE